MLCNFFTPYSMGTFKTNHNKNSILPVHLVTSLLEIGIFNLEFEMKFYG